MNPGSSRCHSTAAVLALIMALNGCSALGLDGGTSERSRLRGNRAKWEHQQISAYRFTYWRSCFCEGPDPIAIEVVNGAVVAAGYESSDRPLTVYLQAHLPTVDTLFAIIDRALAQRVDLLEADYHPVLGYPTRIALDYRFNVADDEFVHHVGALTITPDD